MTLININKPLGAAAVVLEDEPHISHAICDGIEEDGVIRCSVTETAEQFYNVIDSTPVFVASIDFYLSSPASKKGVGLLDTAAIQAGRSAIQYVRREQPWAVIIAYTNDNGLRDLAMRNLRVDFFYDKGRLAPGEYQAILKEAVKLGMDRYIAHYLIGKTFKVPTLPQAGFLESETEHQLYLCACDALRSMGMDGDDARELRAILVQRGWWIDEITTNEPHHLSEREVEKFIVGTGGQIIADMIWAHCMDCDQCLEYVEKQEAAESAIHTYQCWVDSVRHGIAYLTMTDETGELIEAKYDASQLVRLGIEEGAFLKCRIVQLSNGIAVRFRKSKPPVITEEEWNASLREIESEFATIPEEATEPSENRQAGEEGATPNGT